MKIGIYSPYLSILGGGERYLLTIAQYLSVKHDVCLFSSPALKDKAEQLLNLDLSRINFCTCGRFNSGNFLQRIIFTGKFAAFFYMTDGSLFFSLSGKNFLIVQSPSHLPALSVNNRLKLMNWKIICYSEFMKAIIDKTLGVNSFILSPGIATGRFKANRSEKENIILTVGRFFPYPHNKKQDFLVETFGKNYDKFKGWKLIIAGGLTEKGGEKVLAELREKSAGLPVEIMVNATSSRLLELYKKAKIYWHAAGYGEDLEKFPQRAEHFGITTLEAMAAGVVPVVFKGGGQKDIVAEGVNGYFWRTGEELIEKTSILIQQNTLLAKVSLEGIKRSADFSLERFYDKIQNLVAG